MGSTSTVTENDKRSYANIIKDSVKKEDCEPLKEDMQILEMKKNKEDDRAWKQSSTTHDDDFRRSAPTRRPPIPRYQKNFFGLCYSCNNYGHKTIDCRPYARNRNTWSKNSMRTLGINFKAIMSKSHVEPLIEITTNLEQ